MRMPELKPFRGHRLDFDDVVAYIREIQDYVVSLTVYSTTLNKHRGKKTDKLCSNCGEMKPHYTRKSGSPCPVCVDCTKGMLPHIKK